MPDYDALLSNLKRVDGQPLNDADKAALREFFDAFLFESDEKLDREREEMRLRLKVPTVTKRGPEGIVFRRQTNWPHPMLDEAKREVLTAIIQERTRAKLQPPAPPPSKPPDFWSRYVAFTGGTGRALVYPLSVIGGALAIWGLLKAIGLA